MTSTEVRFEAAIAKFLNSGQASSSIGYVNKARLFMLQRAFKRKPFIYGSTGPNSLQTGGTGSPIVKAAKLILDRANRKPSIQNNPRFQNLTLYDPGVRTNTYLRDDCQMMDMYYGIDNDLFAQRDPVIAEFIHYAMEYDTRGVAYDNNVSGRDAYYHAFSGETTAHHQQNPTAGAWTSEGYMGGKPWMQNAYGQSATKEISKIIRMGIQRWGGKLIFEGKTAFGENIFHPGGYRTDTAAEARSLFPFFQRPNRPETGYGTGILEFQWGGVPTTPTRAHFLSNWFFIYGQRKSHMPNNMWNPTSDKTNETEYRAFVAKMISPAHGMEAIWNNFIDMPRSFEGLEQDRVIAMSQAIVCSTGRGASLLGSGVLKDMNRSIYG